MVWNDLKYPGAVMVFLVPPGGVVFILRNGSRFRTRLEGIGHGNSLTISC